MKLIPLVFPKENGGRWQKLANVPEDIEEYWREWDYCQDMWLRNKNNIWKLTEPKDKILKAEASVVRQSAFNSSFRNVNKYQKSDKTHIYYFHAKVDFWSMEINYNSKWNTD